VKSAEFLLLEELMAKLGMLIGQRTRGRKPNAYWEAKQARTSVEKGSVVPYSWVLVSPREAVREN
jgi:hypothetical protein